MFIISSIFFSPSWNHAYDYLDHYLQMNRAWTLQVTEKWEVSRCMEVCIIAVQPWNRNRDPAKSVLTSYGTILIGPPIGPSYSSIAPYTQINLGTHDGGRRVIDLGVDTYRDNLWAESGGHHQNVVPASYPGSPSHLWGHLDEDENTTGASSDGDRILWSDSDHGMSAELTSCHCPPGELCPVCEDWSPNTRREMANLSLVDSEPDSSTLRQNGSPPETSMMSTDG